MELTLARRIAKKVTVYRWRLRYWWMDTREGELMQRCACAAFALASVVQIIRASITALAAAPVPKPVEAIWPVWVIQLIIAVVAAAISYAMRPKTEKPKPQSGEAPTIEDGQSIKHHFGTVWVDDELVLAWKVTGTTPIKTKSGKK